MRIESVEIYGDKREEEGRLEIAKNMLKDGVSVDRIANYTNLTTEQINNL